jgi:hypothetical protein
MYLTNLKIFMFVKVTWTTPMLATQKLVKRGKSDQKERIVADLRDLVSTKRSKSLPASFNFGESKVTTNMIWEYEASGYFPAGDGHAPLDEEIPTPAPGEVVVFETSLHVDSYFPVTLCWLLFWRNFR